MPRSSAVRSAAPDASERPAAAPEAAHAFDDNDDAPSLPKRQTSFAQRGPRSGMVRMFVNLGGMDGTRPADIAGMLYSTVQDIKQGSIGTIDVLEKCSFVEIPEDNVEAVLEAIRQQPPVVRGREVRMDYADRPGDTGGIRPRFGAGGSGGFGGGYKKPGFGGGFKKPFGGGGGFKKPGFGGGGGYGGGGGGGFRPRGPELGEGEGPSPGYGPDSGGGGGHAPRPRKPFGGGGFKKGGFGGGGGGFKKKW